MHDKSFLEDEPSRYWLGIKSVVVFDALLPAIFVLVVAALY
jgi:hypothetical protein